MKMLKRLGVPKNAYKSFVNLTGRRDIDYIEYASRDCYLAKCDDFYVIICFPDDYGKCYIRVAYEVSGLIFERGIFQNYADEVRVGYESFKGKDLYFDIAHLDFRWTMW